MAQRSSGCLMFLVLAAAAAGLWYLRTVALMPFREPLSEHPQQFSDGADVRKETPKVPAEPASASPQLPLPADLESGLTPEQLARSSWENPFIPSMWNAPGWIFDEASFRPARLPSPSATFRRPWSQLVVSFTLAADRSGEAGQAIGREFVPGGIAESLDDSIEIPPSDQSLPEPPLLTVVLASRDALVSVRVEFLSDRTRVLTQDRGSQRLLTESQPSGDDRSSSEPGNGDDFLAITLTPNRLLIRRAGRIEANASRPKGLQGTACYLQFQPGSGFKEIADLRLEGD